MSLVHPIPNFDGRGLLPAGDYQVTFDQIRRSHLVRGDGASPTWDVAWRRTLVDHCEEMVAQLWAAGVTTVVLDGSFVEAKDRPSDIDGYFECELRALAALVARLNAGDPGRLWDWDPARRTLDAATGKRQLPMWHRHHVELYPHTGQPSGIPDRHGHAQLFPAAFRQQRGTYEPKGVLVVVQPQGGVQ